jgi:hypothetical protein
MDCSKEGTPLVSNNSGCGGGGQVFSQQPQSSYVQYIAVRRNVRTYRLKTPEELEREKQGGGAGAGPPYGGLGANVKKMIFGCYTG